MEKTNELAYLRAASLIFDTPLLLGRTQGLLIGEYLAARIQGLDAPAPQGNQFQGEKAVEGEGKNRRWKGYSKIGSIARINLMGELVNRGAWMGSHSGMTSYEGFSEQLSKALGDDKIEQIILDVNSPGGQASGMIETSRRIRAASIIKPVTAVVNSMAASAAYGLISGATQIVATESSELGSIGVLLVHFDRSKAMEERGVKATIIHAGDRKVDGHPFGPLEGDALAALESRVGKIMDQFVGLISEHRGVDAQSIRDLQAGILTADEAVGAGLADRIATFDEVIVDLNTRASIGRTNPHDRRISMSSKQSEPAANQDAGITQATHDAAIAEASASAKEVRCTLPNSFIWASSSWA